MNKEKKIKIPKKAGVTRCYGYLKKPAKIMSLITIINFKQFIFSGLLASLTVKGVELQFCVNSVDGLII